MRSADPLITVSAVARDHSAEAPSRGPLLAASGQSQWPVIAVLAVCAALITLAVSAGPYPHDRGQRLLLAIVVCGLITALRRWPLPVLAAAALANTMVMAAGNAPLPFGIVLGLASYLSASRLPRRMSIPAAAASAAALGAALVYVAFTAFRAPVAVEAVEGFLPLVAGWFTGDSVAARRRYLTGLAEQAERARAAEAERARQQVREERVRIARELHDVVAHTLAVITVQAGVGRRLMAKRPEEASTALESIETIGRTAQEELRVVLGLLRDEENGTAALAPAPRLVDVKELVETVRVSGTPVDLHMSGADRPLSPALELSVYRVVQEALTNVVKHAPGARAAVDLAVCDREILLDVTDDGGPAGPGRRRAAGRPGTRDRRDARADRSVRRAAGCRAGRRTPGLPGDRPGPDRGCGVTTRVLVVDDQALLRTAFSSLIDAEDDLDVAGEAADGRQAVELAASLAPDVVVMDVRMPVMDGIEATRQIFSERGRGAYPRVLILTTFDLDEYVFEALRAGASGFALKSRPLEELLSAIRTVAAGEALLAPSVTRRLIAHFTESDPAPRRTPRGLEELTEREREVLSLVARGLSNAELAETLHVSLPTAKTHVSRILTKLGARDRTQLVILAYESGLVTTA